ncbi:hypothetical protein [uncultured Dialister sp.]|uniref:hypothetical protein n=1 Tax=uncultured Dialister sp. TaxID=278064 RepID=UPI0025EECD4A|nr:hypothetical protein [uncultured Dialister sp.]
MREIKSGEAIVLHSSQGREGGKTLSLFTASMGPMPMILPRAVMTRCGSGLTAPFAIIRFTASVEDDFAVLSQYEGRLLFDIMKLPYEEMTYWFYVIELTEKLFPQRQKDDGAYDTLLHAGAAGAVRNSLPLCFMTAVKLLAQSGFDAASPEEAEENHLSPEALSLLTAFRDYRWQVPFSRPISRNTFHEAAAYVENFVERACDIRMHTKGAFLGTEGS